MGEFGWTKAGARRSSPVPAVPGDVILGCWLLADALLRASSA